ncbi:unnamed protein product, partial [Nesidiocoris tenuis]
ADGEDYPSPAELGGRRAPPRSPRAPQSPKPQPRPSPKRTVGVAVDSAPAPDASILLHRQ